MKYKNIEYAEKHFWNSVKNLTGTVVYYFCQWLTLMIIIRIAGYAVSGEFSLIISFTNIFGILSQYNIRSFQLSDVNNRFLSQQYSGVYVITSVSAVVLFLFALPFSGFNRNIIISCMIYMIFKLCETFTNYVFTYMQLEDKYFDIVISYCLKGFIPMIGFAGWLYFTQSLFQSLCIMSLLYIAIIFFYDIKKTRSYFPNGIVMKDVIVILKECFPITLSPLIITFMLYLTRHSIENIYGVAELGYYSAVTMVIAVVLTIAWAIYYVLLPIIADKYIKRLKSDIIRIVFIVLGVILVTTLLSFLLVRLVGNLIFSFVFGVEILEYMYLLFPVIITSAMLAVMAFTSVCLIAMQKRFAMLIGMLAGAVLLTVSVVPMTRSGGMLGNIRIFTISLCLMVIVHGFLILRNLWRI